MLEKYEEIYGCYPKSPYAGGFRGSFVASLSLPTQGGLVGLYPFILLYKSKNISAGYWVKNGRLRFIQYR